MGTFLKTTTIILIILWSLPALGLEQVITLDDPGAVACNENWLEGGCWIMLTETTSSDCHTPGICFFNADLWPGGLYFPYRMLVGLENFTNIETIEVDIYDGWEIGCVRVWLYSGQLVVDQDGSHVVGNWETLFLSTGGVEVTQLVISGWEGAVDEIRLVGENLTPADGRSWSALKSLY